MKNANFLVYGLRMCFLMAHGPFHSAARWRQHPVESHYRLGGPSSLCIVLRADTVYSAYSSMTPHRGREQEMVQMHNEASERDDRALNALREGYETDEG